VLKILFLDTETRSRTDISAGTDRYTRDAQCRIVTYVPETGPAKIYLPFQTGVIPRDLYDPLMDPETILVAHNAVFDRLILDRSLHVRTQLSRWFCTMACASAHGLPGSLEALGKVCGLSEDEAKLTDDKGLIHTFCVPQAATGKFIEPHEAPLEWDRFCRYAIRDTEALRAIYYKMPKHNYGY
jgi:DNA polymerase